MERYIIKNGKKYYTTEYFKDILAEKYNQNISSRTATRYMKNFKSLDGYKRPRLFTIEVIRQAVAGYAESLRSRKVIDVNTLAFSQDRTKVATTLIYDTFEFTLEDIETKKVNVILNHLLKLHNLEFDEKQLEQDHDILNSEEKGHGTKEERKKIRQAYHRYINNDYIKEKKQDN